MTEPNNKTNANLELTCVVIDDEDLAVRLLHDYIKKTPGLTASKSFYSAKDALEYLQHNDVDIVFTDIQMPYLNGLQLIRSLKTKHPVFIINSAYPDFALEGYGLDVIDYLLKPVSFERFTQAVNKAKERVQFKILQSAPLENERIEQYINFRADKKNIRLAVSSILYIEALKQYVKIYTISEVYITLQSLHVIETELPSDQFVRVHKSFLVSIAYISSSTSTHIKIKDKIVPLGRKYKNNLKSILG